MQSLKNIDKQIKTLKDRLETVKGTETEVYTRIVGYYRSIKNWNNGKRSEYNFRSSYNINDQIPVPSKAF